MCLRNGGGKITAVGGKIVGADKPYASYFGFEYNHNSCWYSYCSCRNCIFQVLLHILLNLLILPAVGVLFGAVLAYGAKRGIAYIIIAVVTLLSTPLAGDWCVTIYKATGFSASVLTRLFPFMTPSTMLISSDLAYGYSLRPYRIFAYAVWILVLCAVLFFYISKERGKRNGCSLL